MSAPVPPKPVAPPRFFLHALAFLVLLALWTWKLLSPHPVPDELKAELAAAGLSLVAAKGLHAGGYAFLTVLALTLPAPRRCRRFLVGLLVAHGAATEIGQHVMALGRTGRGYDIVIDWIGIALGVLAVQIAARRKTRTGRSDG